jgi:hypothetical protein
LRKHTAQFLLFPAAGTEQLQAAVGQGLGLRLAQPGVTWRRNASALSWSLLRQRLPSPSKNSAPAIFSGSASAPICRASSASGEGAGAGGGVSASLAAGGAGGWLPSPGSKRNRPNGTRP